MSKSKRTEKRGKKKKKGRREKALDLKRKANWRGCLHSTPSTTMRAIFHSPYYRPVVVFVVVVTVAVVVAKGAVIVVVATIVVVTVVAIVLAMVVNMLGDLTRGIV